MLHPGLITVLDKKITNGVEFYLIQRLGEHKLKAEWLQRDAVFQQYEGSKAHLAEYDRELEIRCKRIKTNLFSTPRRNNADKSS